MPTAYKVIVAIAIVAVSNLATAQSPDAASSGAIPQIAGCYDIRMGTGQPRRYEITPAPNGEYRMTAAGGRNGEAMLLKRATESEIRAVREQFSSLKVRYGLTVKWPQNVPSDQVMGMFWIADRQGEHIMWLFMSVGEAKKTACF